MNHKSITDLIVTTVVGLLIVAALTPQLIALSDALVPLVIALGVVIAVLRLVFFNTRH